MDASSLLLYMDEDGIVDLTSYQQGTKKRKRSSSSDDTGIVHDNNTTGSKLNAVPQINVLPTDSNLLQAVYSTFHVLYIKAPEVVTVGGTNTTMTWKNLQSVFDSLGPKDQETWCIETKGSDKTYTPHEFLQPKVTQDRGYCSFLVQKKPTVVEGSPSQLSLPLEQLTEDWSQGDCTWIFFGRNVLVGGGGSAAADDDNNDRGVVEGRPEHTDAVSHDGTWHYQLSGRKTWFLRPTLELIHSSEAVGVGIDPTLILEVSCQEGDILVVNTRLWWHRTEIPPQHVPSVSYARDFFFTQDKREQTLMSNVDGMYAVTDIEEGTIVLREEDVPDCELHRSKDNPNCQVVMLEDEDVYAVVSIRPIKAGEFFCIAESEDDDEEEEDDDDDDDGSDLDGGDESDGQDWIE